MTNGRTAEGRVAEGRITPAALGQLGLAVVLLGVGWPVTKAAQMHGAGPAWFALGRATLSMLAMGVAVAAAGQARLPRRRDLPTLGALGLLQIGSFFALSHLAVTWVPAGRTAILANAALVWTVPITLLLTRERMPVRRWAATGLGLLGVVVMVGPWAVDWADWRVLVGNAFLMGAALSWALAMFVMRRFPPVSSVFALMPWAFALAAAELVPVALSRDPGTWNGVSLGWLGLIGVVSAPLGTWCITEATMALPLVVASVGFLAGPVVGLVLSVLWLGEPLTADIVVGAALILGGAAIGVGSARA